MMTINRKLYARASTLPAIAAALVLSSTPLSAQEAQPVTADPPPATTAEPAAPKTAPVTTETTTTTEEPATEASPVATKTTKTVTRTIRATHTAAKPATRAMTSTTHTVARTAAPAAPAAPTAQPSQSAVARVVDLNSTPAAPPTAAAQPAKRDETLPIAGGALALLALGGAGIALAKRRRRHEEEEWVEEAPLAQEPAVAVAPEPEPVIHDEQPKILAPSAFAWGNTAAEPKPAAMATSDDDDRMPGESWVERAKRGPTPNNPSVSLRVRLKRAAFFDKREREVAAGTAKPVDMDAGLPEAMVEEQERELA